MSNFQFIAYGTSDDGRIATITLNRPKFHNAQNRGLLLELDQAFGLAEADDGVRVIILRGEGKSFSAGHDLGSPDYQRERTPGPEQDPSYQCNGGTFTPVESRLHQEWHYFYQNTLRWRNNRKITIAQVQGKVFSAGLMLAWACDLIVAEEGTIFADVVGTRLGMCGVEYFAHPWEFGPRLAKELLLTGDAIDAERAVSLGMVSKIFKAGETTQQTVAFAQRIARLPSMTSTLIKQSVNDAQDAMGFTNALSACFSLHQLNHAHWSVLTDGAMPIGTPEHGLPDWKTAPPIAVSDPYQP
ncbi:enoyl-CoA hydratase [Leucobacter exalbidus]|uniref:Enoyl-CoA hydratase n=1 Tax=Leucobacter exalbidus TaxID=662960 RepID=A0A940PUN5_9MICO|nr:enoyl-CoA hydratase [Leucobacter exalbidus]MBP1327282.1 enoyl-CoA hydratase [Leucobacter exalbidus]